MKKDAPRSPAFNGAADRLARSPFALYLASTFEDEATVKGVLDVMDKLGLPLPESHREFMAGTEGALLFLNKYGVVLRIERQQHPDGGGDNFGFYEAGDFSFERIDSNPWVLAPIATLTAGAAIIEICPGCHVEGDINVNKDLQRKLRREGVDFWDDGLRNIGRVPVKTPSFPAGIPVVVDRLAVRELTQKVSPLKKALKDITGITRREEKECKEAQTAEENLYRPLQESFAAAWPDRKKMKDFWALCVQYVANGGLVTGWNEHNPWGALTSNKGTVAKIVADGYAKRMGA